MTTFDFANSLISPSRKCKEDKHRPGGQINNFVATLPVGLLFGATYLSIIKAINRPDGAKTAAAS